jgi:O-antigen/teichoic acid export membrane protein
VNRILREFIAYLPSRVLPALIALLAIPILTRLLDPAQYGRYVMGITSLTLIGSLCFLWIVSVVIRFHSVTSEERLWALCRPLLALSFTVATLVWIIAAQLLGTPYSHFAFLTAGLLWLLGYAALEFLAGWLRAQNRARDYGLVLVWRSIAGLALAVLMLVVVAPVEEAVIVAAALVSLPALIAILWPRWKLIGHAEGGAKVVSRRELLAYGLPAALSNFGVVGLSLAPRFVVEHVVGTEAVAVYGAAYDIAERSIFFVNAMMLLSSSVMAIRTYEREGGKAAAGLLGQMLRFYLIVAMSLCVFLVGLAPEIVALLLPPQYESGALILMIVAPSAIFVGIMHRYSLVLSFVRRTDLVMASSLAALAINVSAALVLVPRFGLIGAGGATAMGYASWLLLVRVAARAYIIPSFPWLTLFRLAFACAGTLLVLRLFAAPDVLSLVLAIGAGSFSLPILLVLSGEVRMSELRQIAKGAAGRT